MEIKKQREFLRVETNFLTSLQHLLTRLSHIPFALLIQRVINDNVTVGNGLKLHVLL